MNVLSYIFITLFSEIIDFIATDTTNFFYFVLLFFKIILVLGITWDLPQHIVQRISSPIHWCTPYFFNFLQIMCKYGHMGAMQDFSHLGASMFVTSEA